MRRLATRLWIGWLVLGLGLVLVPAAQARTATDRDTIARLTQSPPPEKRAASNAEAIRTAVGEGFVAINGANKKLLACKWGRCTEAGKGLRRTAQYWLGVLRSMKGETGTLARGLAAARTSLRSWNTSGLDAIRADAAARAKSQKKFDAWYRLYKKHYRLAVEFQNRAVSILS